MNHPGKTITIYDLSGILTPAFNVTYTARNAVADFATSGVYLLPRNAISDDDLINIQMTDFYNYFRLPTMTTANLLLDSLSSPAIAASEPFIVSASVPFISSSETSTVFAEIALVASTVTRTFSFLICQFKYIAVTASEAYIILILATSSSSSIKTNNHNGTS